MIIYDYTGIAWVTQTVITLVTMHYIRHHSHMSSSNLI